LTTKFTQHTAISLCRDVTCYVSPQKSHHTPLKFHGPLNPAPRTLASASALHSLAISGTAPRP